MVVTTTPSARLKIATLKANYPKIKFTKGALFLWSPNENTVYYDTLKSHEDDWTLLHELAHGLLGHASYTRDVDLIHKETQAWEYAITQLAPRYGQNIGREYTEAQLDSYREWLHRRSLCPECSQTGVQQREYSYKCLNCGALWGVNDARQCALRRHKLLKTPG